MKRATDVRQVGVRVPPNVRAEWSRRRNFGCACGFTGRHPFCQSCGLAIGPEHLQTHGAYLPIDVYLDEFDDEMGVWKVVCRPEARLVCLDCLRRHAERGTKPQPIRRSTRVRPRLLRMNTWRRSRGLRPLRPFDPAPEGENAA